MTQKQLDRLYYLIGEIEYYNDEANRMRIKLYEELDALQEELECQT